MNLCISNVCERDSVCKLLYLAVVDVRVHVCVCERDSVCKLLYLAVVDVRVHGCVRLHLFVRKHVCLCINDNACTCTIYRR